MDDIVSVELKKLGRVMIELSEAPEEVSEGYILRAIENIMACMEEIVGSKGEPNLKTLEEIHNEGKLLVAEEAIRNGIFPPDTDPEEALRMLEGRA